MVISIRNLIGLVLAAVALVGCGDGGLELAVRFDRVEGLKADAPVIFDQRPIGSVTRVNYRDGGDFLVELRIEPDAKALATEQSRFFIASAPGGAGGSAIEMIRLADDGVPLAPGARVEGSTRYGAAFDRMGRDLEAALDDLTRRLSGFLDELKRFPESDQARRLEAELDRLLDRLDKMGRAAREQLTREILPRIREEIERLRKALERQGREGEMESIDRKLKRLEREMSV